MWALSLTGEKEKTSLKEGWMNGKQQVKEKSASPGGGVHAKPSMRRGLRLIHG